MRKEKWRRRIERKERRNEGRREGWRERQILKLGTNQISFD